MTLDDARRLKYGDEIHEEDCILNVGKRGGVQTRFTVWRVNGMVRTWKRDPDRIEVPCKHGMYEHFTFTARNLPYLHLPQDCPLSGLTLWDASQLEMPA